MCAGSMPKGMRPEMGSTFHVIPNRSIKTRPSQKSGMDTPKSVPSVPSLSMVE